MLGWPDWRKSLEPNQFDRAAAQYREEPVVLYYLSHDPVEAAQAACDFHVGSGLVSAVAMLSCAWHELNPNQLPLDAKAPYEGLFLRYTPPARQRDARAVTGGDPFYPTYTGDRSCWLLGAQRIGDYTHSAHPNSQWARSSAANYRWAHSWGIALSEEHKYRFGRYHRDTPMLWTLEPTPPHLESTQGATEPAPVVPADSVVTDSDGYFDTPASYRLYYNLHKQALMQWTKRKSPVWAQPKALG